MAHDPNTPTRNHEHASEEHPDPACFASALFEHLAFVHGTDADLYLARVISEAFDLSPIAREHICDLILLVDLTEELHRRGEPGREAARMVAEIQRDWTQGR